MASSAIRIFHCAFITEPLTSRNMSGLGKSKLRKAIEHGIAEGDLRPKLKELDPLNIKTMHDAEDVCWGLEQLGPQPQKELLKLVRELAVLFQQVEDAQPGVTVYLKENGTPHLLRIYDSITADDEFETTNCLMFLLKILALCNTEEGTARIIAAARRPLNPDGYMWTIVLGIFAEGHNFREQIFSALADPFPPAFIAVAFLDLANKVAIKDEFDSHPFDSPQGIEKLRSWLRDPEHHSYAHSATAALPFISEPARAELLQLAMDHPDQGVSIEAAWAGAKIGQERGITQLARFAANVNTAAIAIQYLQELGREDAVPESASDPDFQAKAAMVSWLSHGMEYGEPPDSIELYDTRELFWPPTDDRRRVWLFKYRYAPSDHREEEDIGLGMVGSSTFSLFGEVTADLEPMDAYALHCCWEMQTNNDPRAPKDRSIAAGREILAKHNPL